MSWNHELFTHFDWFLLMINWTGAQMTSITFFLFLCYIKQIDSAMHMFSD